MKNPMIVMTAITGKPTKEEIRRYLSGLLENGIEQAMLYPRSGCEVEYLSSRWFEVIEWFVTEASSLGMSIWLYDDFNWPSGDAGGRVTQNPSYRLKAIKIKGERKGEISCKSRHNRGLFGERFFPDLLSPEAVEYFIKCTHEEYKKRLSPYFGNVIKGIFTDEPSIGYCCEEDSIPYYEGIEEDYRLLCGGDFKNDLEWEREGLYENAHRAVAKRFRQVYLGRLKGWCQDNGLIMTGHLMSDSYPKGATKHGGEFLKSLSAFGMPGVDEISTDFRDGGEMILFGACRYARGEQGAMAELFALGPCDMTYAKKRCMLYLAGAFGIDHYFLAISHLDMRGNRHVTDFFNNFNTDQPDFGGMRLLAKEAEKAASLAGKSYTPDVYVRFPHGECVRGLQTGEDVAPFWETVNELSAKGIQWSLIDEESPKDAPVIELDMDRGCTVNGEPFHISKIKSAVSIKGKDGRDVGGIFVRRYDDGDMLVLNLYEPAGVYLINEREVYLDEYGVSTLTEQALTVIGEADVEFDVVYSDENLIRTMHLNGEKRAEICANYDTPLTVFTRKEEEVLLNGTSPEWGGAEMRLCPGLACLYKASRQITLPRGTNILEADNDYKYLPTAFIGGDFDYEIISGDVSKILLKERVRKYKSGQALHSYGRVELTAKIDLPQDAGFIELCGARLYTLVYINGKQIGESIAPPYVFPIHKEHAGGEVEIKIVQFSSIAPIFGDVRYWDKNVKECGWRGTPSPTNPSFGFNKLSILKGEEK